MRISTRCEVRKTALPYIRAGEEAAVTRRVSLWFYFPAKARFILSIVPRRSQGFHTKAEQSGDNLVSISIRGKRSVPS